MIGLQIILDGDGAFQDLEQLDRGTLERVALLQLGTAKGKPSVALLVQDSGGRHIMGETTLLLLEGAVSAMVARVEMGDPNWRDDP